MAVHDFTERSPGHDVSILTDTENGDTVDIVGWGSGIQQHDIVIFRTRGRMSKPLPFTVQTINYHLEPSDMWSATVVRDHTYEEHHDRTDSLRVRA